jgi:hypothetical protein
MLQTARNTYEEPLWAFEDLGEWELSVYEDHVVFIDFYEQVAEIVFKTDWE